jgi:hypothetical protein
MTSQRKEIQYESENSPDFKVIFIDGIIGAITPSGGRIAFFVDIPISETGNVVIGETKPPEIYTNKIKREFLIDVRMSPESFKGIAKWMNDNIAAYDKMIQAGASPKPGEATQSQYQ